ncbi:MAG: CMP-N,N-diacetyllegionaminic acid synthase [Alphaproteobacteria bacterium]|nr:CMP-N,N-diacetyllegionaminic acid synthase [Alphaproteobacteria bacterium]
MSRVCTICARGGSKGVPGKNLREVLGKPLIAYSIEQARRSELFEAIAVSSDSQNILDAASHHGADVLVLRPDHLATDEAPKCPAIKHCLEAVERARGARFPIFVDLQVTSPLREPADIVGAVRLLEEAGVTNVITGSKARCSPYFSLVERDARGFVRLSKASPQPVARRQDSPECFDMNGSIYVWRRDPFMQQPAVFYEDTLLYEMPAERSLDIDTEFDFAIVEMIMRDHRTKHPS